MLYVFRPKKFQIISDFLKYNHIYQYTNTKRVTFMQTEILIAVISATATVSAGIAAGFFEYMKVRNRKNKLKSNRKPLTQQKLFDNELFSKSDYWLNFSIHHLGFESGHRAWIYETIMRNKIFVVSKKAKEFLETIDLATLSDNKFENAIFKLISEMVKEYNDAAKEDFKEKFGKAKGEKIFELVMNKQSTPQSPSAGFNIWHEVTITYLEKSITDHCAAYYPNNIEKMDMILSELKAAVGTAHAHLYKTFKNFNGELNRLLE